MKCVTGWWCLENGESTLVAHGGIAARGQQGTCLPPRFLSTLPLGNTGHRLAQPPCLNGGTAMRRFLVCSGVHGRVESLEWLHKAVRQRRPDGVLFAGG